MPTRNPHALISRRVVSAAAEAERTTPELRRWRPKLQKNLFSALKEEDTAALQRLLDEGGQALINELYPKDDSLGCQGFGLLHVAVYVCRSAALVDFLADRGADLEVRNAPMRETPLIMAGMYCPAAVHALLRRGAKPEAADWHGSTAVSRCRERLETMERLAAKEGAATDRPGRTIPDFRAALAALEAALSAAARSPAAIEADALREQGNAAYQRGDFAAAERLYSQSLARFEDHRALSNRAACHLRRAVDIAAEEERPGPPGHLDEPPPAGAAGNPRSEAAHRLFMRCFDDAARAAALCPGNAKAWLRKARGQMGMRDFPRALFDANDGVKHCPGDARLLALQAALRELRVSNAIRNAFSPKQAEFQQEMMRHMKSGGAMGRCAYCCMLLPAPLAKWGGKCPLCNCDPRGGGVQDPLRGGSLSCGSGRNSSEERCVWRRRDGEVAVEEVTKKSHNGGQLVPAGADPMRQSSCSALAAATASAVTPRPGSGRALHYHVSSNQQQREQRAPYFAPPGPAAARCLTSSTRNGGTISRSCRSRRGGAAHRCH